MAGCRRSVRRSRPVTVVSAVDPFGKLKEALRSLAQHLRERGKLNLEETLADATSPTTAMLTFLAGSRFEVPGRHTISLLRTLPPLRQIKKAVDQARLRWSLEFRRS